ncbi:MAG: hypothetical protein QM796_17250 [Chthoniobacteraceae bacterium]
MNVSPKTPLLVLPACLALSFVIQSKSFAQVAAAEKTVALHTADGKYVSATEKGGIDLSGKVISHHQVFAVAGASGDKLSDGDTVEIKYYPTATGDSGKSKGSYWREESGKIDRVVKEPEDGSAKFKLKKQGDGFALQAASGKFVATPPDTTGLGLTDTLNNALVLVFEENPKEVGK